MFALVRAVPLFQFTVPSTVMSTTVPPLVSDTEKVFAARFVALT
jgi:hypothetical protein